MKNSKRKFEQQLSYSKVVLRSLVKRGPLSRSKLEKIFFASSGTHSKFEGTFSFLKRNGYVEKASEKHRAPYFITERGKRLLEGIE